MEGQCSRRVEGIEGEAEFDVGIDGGMSCVGQGFWEGVDCRKDAGVLRRSVGVVR